VLAFPLLSPDVKSIDRVYGVFSLSKGKRRYKTQDTRYKIQDTRSSEDGLAGLELPRTEYKFF